MAAQNSRRQYSFVPEATFGVTPSTPQMQLVEVTDFGLDMNSATLEDPSLRANRMTVSARRGNKSVQGPIGVAMCADNYDTFLEALLGGTWTSDVLKVGQTQRSFAFEEGFLDINQYRVFNGVVMNTMSMEITSEAIVTAQFGTLGAGVSAFTGTSLDATPTAITAREKFFHEGGTINEGGSPVAFISSMSFEVSNNFQGNYALGSTSYRSLTPGKIMVTGELTALAENFAIYNKFVNNTQSSISVTVNDGAGNSHTYTFPQVQYTEGTIDRGTEGAVMFTVKFTAEYDSVSDTSMSVTRS